MLEVRSIAYCKIHKQVCTDRYFCPEVGYGDGCDIVEAVMLIFEELR